MMKELSQENETAIDTSFKNQLQKSGNLKKKIFCVRKKARKMLEDKFLF
jgi:hypothetical protein